MVGLLGPIQSAGVGNAIIAQLYNIFWVNMSYIFYAVLSVAFVGSMFLWSFFEKYVSKRVRVLFSLLLVFVAMFILSVRGFGLDFNNYKLFYDDVERVIDFGSWFSERLEPGYYAAMFLFKVAGLGFEVFYFAFNLIAVAILFYSYGVSRFNGKLVFIVFALYYFGYMDVTRAFFASAVLAAVLSSIVARRYLLAILGSMLGWLIHYSFFFGLLFVPLSKFVFTTGRYAAALFLISILALCVKAGLSFDAYIPESWPGFVRTGMRYLNSVGSDPKSGYLSAIHVILWIFVVGFVFIVSLFINFLISVHGAENFSPVVQKFHSMSCWGTLVFLFFLIIDAAVLGNRLFFLLSIGLPLLIYSFCFETSVRGEVRLYRYTMISLLFIFGVFFMFLYLAGVHDPERMFYLGF